MAKMGFRNMDELIGHAEAKFLSILCELMMGSLHIGRVYIYI